jgi:hypothetical protein
MTPLKYRYQALLLDGTRLTQAADDVSVRYPEIYLFDPLGNPLGNPLGDRVALTLHPEQPEAQEVLTQLVSAPGAPTPRQVYYQGRWYDYRRYTGFKEVSEYAQRDEVVEFGLLDSENQVRLALRLLPSTDPEYQPGDFWVQGVRVPFSLDPSLMACNAAGEYLRPRVQLRYWRDLRWEGGTTASLVLKEVTYRLGWHVDLPEGGAREYYVRISDVINATDSGDAAAGTTGCGESGPPPPGGERRGEAGTGADPSPLDPLQ